MYGAVVVYSGLRQVCLIPVSAGQGQSSAHNMNSPWKADETALSQPFSIKLDFHDNMALSL